MPREKAPEELAEEQASREEDQRKSASKKGKLQSWCCKVDTYWKNRWRPGDIVEFDGDPPEDFPEHNFERG